VAMIIVGVLNSTQLYDNWHSISTNNTESVQAATPVLTLFNELQTERQLSAAVLADPGGYQEELDQQRKATDTATTSLFALPGNFPGAIESGVQQIETALAQLNGYRTAVDERSATQQQVYDDYTGLINTDLQLFSALSNSGLADVNYYYRPIEASLWGEEMISRENAVITPAVVGGSITVAERSQVAQLVGAEQFIYDDEIVPALPAAESQQYRSLLSSSAWTQKTQVEQFVLGASGSGTTALSAAYGEQWQQSIVTLSYQLQSLNYNYGDIVTSQTDAEVHTMAKDLFVNGGVGALGVLLVVSITVLLTGVLRRRIQILRAAAIDLQVRLPEAVERLRRGESVDTDAEFADEIGRGTDELAMLGRALNAARVTALETSIRQVEQYRGFERLLQRIARRTQLLIGLQAKKISEMERRYENAEVLEALFDLDHLTARLRRYEENLVILGGGQPQRRWRKPVTLLDVLRSAQGEVQDYQRIRIEIEGRMWLSQRAVGAMVHVLAELMENAVSFSKPPTPVEVTASRVGRGLAVEIEDRGMGMVQEQIDEANALMANPPRMDAVSRADDARLGMYVVARLAAGLGVKVEFRASSFGGTRVVVLVPEDLVLDEGPASAPELDELPALPRRLAAVGVAGAASGSSDDGAGTGGQAYAATGGGHNGNDVYNGNGAIGISRPAPAPVLVAMRSVEPEEELEAELAPEPEPDVPSVWVAPPLLELEPGAPRLDPLPRRVRLASLAAELREPRPAADEPADDVAERQSPPRSAEPGRSSATIGAFQRQSRIARKAEEADRDPVHPAPRAEPTREEDRG
jgi:signal transduction histidine kinase